MYESTRRGFHRSDERVAVMSGTGLHDSAQLKQVASTPLDSGMTAMAQRCLFCRYRSPGTGKEPAHA